MSGKYSLNDVNAMTRDQFVAAFGGTFEHSPWIAVRAWESRPFAHVDHILRAMSDAVDCASNDARLALICAHPELAGKAAQSGRLTEHSAREQRSAGLGACTPDELARLGELNAAYRDRFGFPLVVAVKGLDKDTILNVFEARMSNSPDNELDECLRQICKIAALRIAEIVERE